MADRAELPFRAPVTVSAVLADHRITGWQIAAVATGPAVLLVDRSRRPPASPGRPSPGSSPGSGSGSEPRCRAPTCELQTSWRVRNVTTQAGFAAPSTPIVMVMASCRPPFTSVTSSSTAVARTVLPTGTGEGKRTFSQP